MLWWIIVVLVCGLFAVYLALRAYINSLLRQDTKFSLILNKLRQETEAIITEFNRITDRNVTIAEEQTLKLKRLIDQSRKYITRLSKKHLDEDSPPPNYSPQTVQQKRAVHDDSPKSITDSAVYSQIVQLLREEIAPEEIAIRVGVSVSEVEMVSSMLNE